MIHVFYKLLEIYYNILFLLNIELQNCSVNIKRVYSDIYLITFSQQAYPPFDIIIRTTIAIEAGADGHLNAPVFMPDLQKIIQPESLS